MPEGIVPDDLEALLALMELARDKSGFEGRLRVRVTGAGTSREVELLVANGADGPTVDVVDEGEEVADDRIYEAPDAPSLGGIDMSGERMIEMLTDTLVVTSDIVAIFASVGAEALWANDAFATSIPIREADKIWLIELLDEWSKAHFEVNVLPALVQHGRWHGTLTLEPAPGEELPISASIVAHRDENGEIEAVSLVARDLRVPESIDDQVGEGDARLAALVQNVADIIIVVGDDSEIRYASPAASRLLGVNDGDLKGAKLLDRLHPEDAEKCGDFRELAVPDEDGMPPSAELRVRHADDTWRHFDVVATDLTDNPAIAGVVLNARDVTARIEAVQHLADRAYTDPLTLLPNRMRLLDRLGHILQEADDHSVVLVMVDVDKFKTFNDAHGNVAGDELLRQVATRLTEVAPSDHLVARLGGNEFAVVMEGITNVDDGINMAERIRSSLAQPFTIESDQVEITASVGVAVPLADQAPEDVIGDADTAVGIAKDNGRDRVEVLTAELRNHAKRRAHVERRLRRVLDDSDAVQVHYQPIFDLASGRVVSAEALLRVHDDDGALLSPAAFLEAAESTGLIAPLGRQVILETCRQVAAWGEDDDLNTPGEVSVNLSPRQLADPGFPDVVAEAIEEMKLPPERFSLELTESMFISQSRTIDEKIRQVRHLGVRIGLDDFGAGRSSLGYLRRFPLDFVKIDRGLVAGVGSDQEDTAIVRATVELGHNLGLLVVAVGVETQDQLDILELLGCDRAQGFFFSPAVPAEQFASSVAERV